MVNEITATVDAQEWQGNKRWKEINRRDKNCRLAAVLHERAGRIDLVRLTSPHDRIETGVVVPYPRWRQREMLLEAPGYGEEDILVRLAWTSPGAVPLRCHACGYVWAYAGRSGYRTTCPRCMITVYLDKCRVEEM